MKDLMQTENWVDIHQVNGRDGQSVADCGISFLEGENRNEYVNWKFI